MTENQDRFQAGKGLAHRKAEIQATTASIVRVFKAGGVVSEADLDIVEEHIKEMRKTVELFNRERKRELGMIVKTP